MEDGLRVQRSSKHPSSSRRDGGTASGRKWRWGWAHTRWAREESKVCKRLGVFGDGKEARWAGTEGSGEWKMFIVGGDCKAGKVCWQHTTGEGSTRKGPFIYFITFNPQHNSRK